MAVGWFRDTSDNKLVASADSDHTPPTGHDFILKSTIEAAYTGEIWQLGTWDGTTYAPPADILVSFDPLTGAGPVKKAAHDMMDVFDEALAYIVDNRLTWTDDQVTKAIEGIHWQAVNTARDMSLTPLARRHGGRNSARNQRLGRTMVNGNALGSTWMPVRDNPATVNPWPGKDWSWVNPEDRSI